MPVTSPSSAFTAMGSAMRQASPAFRSLVRSPEAAFTSTSSILPVSTLNTFCFCSAASPGAGRFIS